MFNFTKIHLKIYKVKTYSVTFFNNSQIYYGDLIRIFKIIWWAAH